MAELFDKSKKTISEHINNIFKEGELEREAVVAKNATTAADGKFYQVEYYNLDMIISLSYRINSKQASAYYEDNRPYPSISPPTPLNFSTNAAIFSKTLLFFFRYCGLSGLILGRISLSSVPFSLAYSRRREMAM